MRLSDLSISRAISPLYEGLGVRAPQRAVASPRHLFSRPARADRIGIPAERGSTGGQPGLCQPLRASRLQSSSRRPCSGVAGVALATHIPLRSSLALLRRPPLVCVFSLLAAATMVAKLLGRPPPPSAAPAAPQPGPLPTAAPSRVRPSQARPGQAGCSGCRAVQSSVAGCDRPGLHRSHRTAGGVTC